MGVGERFMNRKLNLSLALAAGLLGGLLSRYLTPIPAFAQAPAQTQAPKEIRAQSFILVDDQGRVLGTFAYDGQSIPRLPGTPSIRLYDTTGKEIWRAGGGAMRPASE